MLPDAVIGWLNVICSERKVAAAVLEPAKIFTSTVPVVLPILISSELTVPRFNFAAGDICISSV